MSGALAGLVVLDLAQRAPLAGHMLAQLGAQVTQIEHSGSPALRETAPWVWAAYAAGKKAVSLDFEDRSDRDILMQMIGCADILIDSECPGRLDQLGIGYQTLRLLNPQLIHVSITPFGSTGPKSLWQESDLVLWAAGGPLFPSRDGERAPLRISVPQAWLHAAADAAGGALIAHHARKASGVGQHVDISVQQSVTQATLAATIADAVGHKQFSFGVPTRKTLDLSGSGARTRRSKWPIADGLVEMHLGLGFAAGAKTNNFFAWMKEEGALPERMHHWNWITLPAAINAGEISDDDLEEARSVTAQFFLKRVKADIVREAMTRKIMMAPILTTEDLVQSAHHQSRGFFQNLGLDRMLPGDFAMGLPGGFIPMDPAPELSPKAGASSLRSTFQSTMRSANLPQMPFHDLKVLDLAWVVAGPAIGRVLADYGATVVRVESSRRVDTARAMGPFPDGIADLNRSACYETYNAGKLGLALDLADDGARQVIRDLVSWADVVVESFAPGQMERWGLGYEVLKSIKPDLIMVSTSLMGQDGPYAAFAGFGNIGAAMSGFQHIVGWPDADPIGPFGPYTDYVGPRFALVALLAALRQKDTTGAGAWLDVSQAEAGMQFLAPEIAEYSVTGRIACAKGNRDRIMAPHGVFRCAGEDRWIAIAVRDDDDWQRLSRILGGEALSPQYEHVADRLLDQDELEDLIGKWTLDRAAEDVESALQAAGLAAHRAASSADMVSDPQLAHRGHYVRLAHENGGESVIEASRFRLSDTPPAYRTAPSFGRDNHAVLSGLLKYDDVHIARLTETGIFI